MTPEPSSLTTKTPPSIARIDKLTNFLLVILVGVPFFISFGALRHLAEANNISYPVLYPLMVDFGLIIFKFLALRESLRGRRDGYTWTMAILLTVISVALNIVHVPHTLPTLGLARFMAALPPLVILSAFVAVSRRIEEDARHETAVVNHRALEVVIRQRQAELDRLAERQAVTEKAIASRQQELDLLTQKLDQQLAQFDKTRDEHQCQLADIRDTLTASQVELKTLMTQRNRVRQEIDRLQDPKTTRVKRDSREPNPTDNDLLLSLTETETPLSGEELSERQEMILSLLRAGKNPDDIANQLGVSSRTVYRDIKSLNGLVATVTS